MRDLMLNKSITCILEFVKLVKCMVSEDFVLIELLLYRINVILLTPISWLLWLPTVGDRHSYPLFFFLVTSYETFIWIFESLYRYFLVTFLGDYMVSIMLSPDETRTLQKFRPTNLKYCCNLTNLNISNCFDLDAKIFMDSIQFCSKLEFLCFVNCTQFTEQDITEMLTSLINLTYVDGTGTQEIIFCNALNIVCSLHKLEAINLEPKYIVFERKDWQRMMSKFHWISFGHSIRRMVCTL